ncbi:SEC-C metal-binding domain-containing protein [Sphingobacterium bovistauri]|uniref:SEC-C domain-containing protein n=1 Tax=Sphingobacterium bovistauri TaxID=2781959 RepID=A0ABS7Z8C3_9SPHI|nr:SEC-C metal-binding domain-containing protein [Sphingobacterium bovistauri]MCA5005666.1 SEC-C domain-containing protein [Sphingobacterium bovistauri]
MKIGRNDPCPCGSGKKYKQCHWSENTQSVKEKPVAERHFLSAFDTTDLVKTFAALTILPENHGKNIRLETLVTQSILHRAGSRMIVTVDTLKKYVTKFQPENAMEELPVTLFTENVVNEFGNNIIFPGITESGSFMLTNLMAAIFHLPGLDLPANFLEEMRQASMVLLHLSHKIALRMGYKRYMLSRPTIKEIYFPEQDMLANAKQAVTFTLEEMADILKRFRIDKDTLNKFLLNPTTFKVDEEENSPIVHRPIFANGIDFTIASPATLSLALTNFIWEEAAKQGLMTKVNKAYHSVVWNNSNMYLQQLGFKVFGHKDIKLVSGETRREGLYKFDEDKIALIYYAFDDGRNFNNPRGANMHIQELSERRNVLAKEILALPEFKDYKLLDIIIYSRIGRDLMLAYMANDHSESIYFSPFDISVLAEAKDIDAIDLWNFAISIKEMTKDGFKISLPHIDLFQVYRDHGDVLFLTDDHKAMQFIHFGDSVKLIHEALLHKDEHAEPVLYENHEMWIPVRKNGPYAPVYLAPTEVSERLVFYLNCLPVPVNISPTKPRADVKPALRNMYWQVNDAIAYWIWQAAPYIADYLKALPFAPISLQFELLDEEKFESIERDYKRNANFSSNFSINADSSVIYVGIPPEILPYLYGADNEGERVLLSKILNGFNQLLASNKLQEISADEVSVIVDKAALLSNKKKIFLVDSGNKMLLDQHQLAPQRYVQLHNSNTIIRGFVEGLGEKCPPVGIITDRKIQDDTSFTIVLKQLLPKLTATLAQYNSKELLKELIGLNESLIWKREEIRLQTPTRIACFVSIHQQMVDLKKQVGELGHTATAVRCLIEHITAEPYMGTAIISKTAIDELISIMDLIIEWGGIGDVVKNKLFDTKMEVTADGWINYHREEFDEVLRPFNDKKIKEHVQDSLDAFQQAFPTGDEGQGKDVPKYVDEAFTEEIGISFTRIAGFINALGVIAYKQNTPYATLSKTELLKQVNAIEQPFSNDEFEAAMKYLSLWNRGKVTNTAGFENYDISPWRMNRRLSLLSKPLCLVDNLQDSNNPEVYWGLRQVIDTRTYLFQQCTTNRLRAEDGGPIKRAITKVNKEFNDGLVDNVEARLKSPEFIMDRDRFIGPGAKYFFQHAEDIGDIDVMIIDQKEKILYSLECKNLAPSRNFKEMVEEVNRMFDERMLDKHAVRHEWIKSNLKQFEEKYKVDLTGFSIKSFFVTAEEMLTPHLKNKVLPVPIISLYDIEEKGIEALK